MSSSTRNHGKSAVVIGATGATGKVLLHELLKSPSYSRVGEFGRRLTSLQSLPVGKEKLIQKVIDFEDLGHSRLSDWNWDVVFITLGSQTGRAPTDEEFEKVDREFVVNAARECKSMNPSINQRLVYVSWIGANPKSIFLYTRSKGLTELELANLGYKNTIIFRPAMLTGAQRSERRWSESITTWFLTLRKSWADNWTTPVSTLAKALKNAGMADSDRLQRYETKDSDFEFVLIEHQMIRSLAELQGL